MMAEVVLLTGGNLGDVAQTLRTARKMVEQRVGAVSLASSVMDSAPWGFEAEERFLNQVLVVESNLSPAELLETTQEIERELGRATKGGGGKDGEARYESRTIDIDILYYDDLVLEGEQLVIPHPEIERREFILRPLTEIYPEKIDPSTGLSTRQIYNNFISNKL